VIPAGFPLPFQREERIDVRQSYGRELCLRTRLHKPLSDLLRTGALHLPRRIQRLVFQSGVDGLALAQNPKVVQGDEMLLRLVRLTSAEVIEKVFDTERCLFTDTGDMRLGEVSGEGGAGKRKTLLDVGEIDQLERAERGKERAMLIEVTLEPGERD